MKLKLLLTMIYISLFITSCTSPSMEIDNSSEKNGSNDINAEENNEDNSETNTDGNTQSYPIDTSLIKEETYNISDTDFIKIKQRDDESFDISIHVNDTEKMSLAFVYFQNFFSYLNGKNIGISGYCEFGSLIWSKIDSDETIVSIDNNGNVINYFPEWSFASLSSPTMSEEAKSDFIILLNEFSADFTQNAAEIPFDLSSIVDNITPPEVNFKLQCKELWHDDIFFSNSISKGNYVKLDLFVEEARFFDTAASYAWPSSDLITNYDLQRDFFYCGVQRKDEYSYVGGQINLFFSNQYECSSSDINVGDHLIVYGEIIEFSTNTTDGYNYCSVIPRYIENNGQ